MWNGFLVHSLLLILILSLTRPVCAGFLTLPANPIVKDVGGLGKVRPGRLRDDSIFTAYMDETGVLPRLDKAAAGRR
jgi:hypothetical protein